VADSQAAALHHIRQDRNRGFEPPFQAALARYKSEEGEGALVQLDVTHMLSDGYSIVALLADLAELVAQAESVERRRPLPAVVSPLTSLQARLMRTVAGCEHSDSITHQQITTASYTGRSSPTSTMYVDVPKEVVVAVKRSAQLLAVADDIAMLAVIGVTLSKLDSRPDLAAAIIAPQRDEPGTSETVGLFADIRVLQMITTGLSMAGVALRLHHVVKERIWQAPPVITQSDVPLINFEWTDYEVCHGFTQHASSARWGHEGTFNPIKVVVDQPDRHSWRLRIGFRDDSYPEAKQEQFVGCFQDSLSLLLDRPLETIWPDAASIV